MKHLMCASALVITLASGQGLAAADNAPLLARWDGPFGGVPPFDQVRVDQFKPAFDVAIEAYRAEIRVIAENPASPTFDNTIAELERSGRMLDRVKTVYDVWSSTMSTAEFRQVEQAMEPKLAALRDEVFQNEKLFRRIEAIYQSPDKSKLTPEQQRLVWYHYTNFVRAGAKLDPAGKARVAEINQRLATLYTTFSQNLLADEEEYATVISDSGDLDGLPESFRA
ncbi:MAG: M3 family peptidase, partial [Verrucomicrobiota bacterium]|nr:M3 family peptidase [Verrucomicrobiota bacterium]